MAKKAKTYKGKSMAKGGGGKFAKLKDEVAKGEKKSGKPAAKAEKIAGAVAAIQGRKKYGNAEFQKMAAKGKAKAAKKREGYGGHPNSRIIK